MRQWGWWLSDPGVSAQLGLAMSASGGFWLPDDPGMLCGQVWRRGGIEGVLGALSLSHSINETKASDRCPVAVREIWAVWNGSSPYPRDCKPAVFFGTRPGEPMFPPGWAQMESMGRSFWSEAFGDVGSIPPPKAFVSSISRGAARASLVFRDSRVGDSAGLKARSHMLWRARRDAIGKAPGEVGSLLAAIGEGLAWEVFGKVGRGASGMTDPSQEREARVSGAETAASGLAGSFWENDPERRALDFDFSCREIGEESFSTGSFELAAAMVSSFFKTLSDEGEVWRGLAGGGEQEVFFPYLCALEGRWRSAIPSAGRMFPAG